MSVERRARLDGLGFVWYALTEKWEEGFQHLQAYAIEHGHCRVPHKHVCADGYRLGAWVNKHRQKKSNMPAERRARLDELGFVWDPHAAQWEEGFEHLQEYVTEHGDCRVPDAYVSADGYRLGQWVRVQRREEDRVSPERKTRLDELGLVWDPLADQWEEGFHHLQAFVDEHGQCRVPVSYIAMDGYRLGQWVKVQRRRADRISPERKARLDALGFEWAPKAARPDD